MKKRVDSSPEVARVGGAGVNEGRVVFPFCSSNEFMVSVCG